VINNQLKILEGYEKLCWYIFSKKSSAVGRCYIRLFDVSHELDFESIVL
jgi:hypothetical protein